MAEPAIQLELQLPDIVKSAIKPGIISRLPRLLLFWIRYQISRVAIESRSGSDPARGEAFLRRSATSTTVLT